MSNFPEHFYFGASTSSHQVEGWNFNNWTEWEKKNAARLAHEARTRPPKGGWPQFILATYPAPLDAANYISGEATDHYHRFEEDFDIAKQLGHNAHRFSIEWSRIEPYEGTFNQKEIAHYRDVVAALRRRNMEPFVTLWHWTLPLWLRDQGGVLARRFPEYFGRYARAMAEALPDVKFWFTVNEPEIYCLNSYLRRRWPPERKNFFSFLRAFKKLEQAHRQAYRAIKTVRAETAVGVVCNLSHFSAAGGALNALMKVFFDRFWNHRFLRNTKKNIDVIGLNFYFHNRINYGLNKNADEKVSDVGWDLHPASIEPVLQGLKRYGKPIYITESGLADSRDAMREWFIAETLEATAKAIRNGADVRGYLHWSLLDNFEWDKGFWPRFGLVAVDYRSLSRKIRSSALAYKKIIQNSGGKLDAQKRKRV